jgi:hypothetical protein
MGISIIFAVVSRRTTSISTSPHRLKVWRSQVVVVCSQFVITYRHIYTHWQSSSDQDSERLSECETVQYGHECLGTQNQGWLCWQQQQFTRPDLAWLICVLHTVSREVRSVIPAFSLWLLQCSVYECIISLNITFFLVILTSRETTNAISLRNILKLLARNRWYLLEMRFSFSLSYEKKPLRIAIHL